MPPDKLLDEVELDDEELYELESEPLPALEKATAADEEVGEGSLVAATGVDNGDKDGELFG